MISSVLSRKQHRPCKYVYALLPCFKFRVSSKGAVQTACGKYAKREVGRRACATEISERRHYVIDYWGSAFLIQHRSSKKIYVARELNCFSFGVNTSNTTSGLYARRTEDLHQVCMFAGKFKLMYVSYHVK